jgi:hypothetical protein
MSTFKVKGVIKAIGEPKQLDNGATVLDYIVEVTKENGYKTDFSFNMYKKEEYASHITNFAQYNKVGDNVEVEFDIRSREYNGKTYNDLSHWKLEKVISDKPIETDTEEIEPLPF